MAITISGSQVLISGNETGLSLRTFYGSNPTAGKQLTANTIEALFQLKIQNGANLDTSDVALVINHRVEGQANATTDTGIWTCSGGVIIVQGSAAQYAEDWAIQQWENVQVYIQKTGGYQAFIGSQPRPTPSSFKNVKFIVKNGDIDAHLQATEGTGTLENVLLRNEGTNAGIIALRDTDTSDIEMYRIEPFGWNPGTPSSFHKNMKLYNTSANEINYNYRRNNGGAVFYNTINSFNGNRMTAVRYVSNGASAGDGARSVIVGAYKPTIINTNNSPVSGFRFRIFKNSDSSIEASGTTGSDGKPYIVQGSTNTDEQSYNNTFVVSGTTYNRIIREAGVKYIKQSITPTTTGGNVVSVDQGTFTIKQRKYDKQSIETSQSFSSDYDGFKVSFNVPYLTLTETQALALTGITLTPSGATGGTITLTSARTVAEVWQFYRAWISQTANFGSDDTWTYDGTTFNVGNWTLVGAEFLTGKITTTSATASGAMTSLTINGNVSQATPTNLSNVVITGTLTYNTNTATSITLTNTTIGTVANSGTGIVTITPTNSSITTYTDAEINFLDSDITFAGVDSITFYPTSGDANAGTNAGATITTSPYNFKYGSVISGVTMSGTLNIRYSIGGKVTIGTLTIAIGTNTFSLTDNELLGSINANGAKTTDLQKVNRNVIKASKLIPANEIV